MSAKPTPLSGFPELLPEQRIVEQQIIDTLRHTFELYGFGGMETRAVEPLDQLLRKGDTSKEVYLLRRLHEESPEGHAGMGLHFDLTVPFARYVLENAGKLEFPFRRHQIQRVWRGERPQEGRFREFLQADIDVVGRDTLPFHHDVEVARVMVDALTRLDFLPAFRLQVNNRKLIQGFYLGLGVTEPDEVMRLVDKLDKLPAEKVHELLVTEAGIDAGTADRVLALATIRSADDSFVQRVRDLGVEHPLLDEGLDELARLVTGVADLVSAQVGVEADLAIARGLDYYTGTVFETRLDGYESLGSICSGAGTTRWPATVARPTRGGHLARRQPRRRTADRADRAGRGPEGAQRRPGRPGRRGEPGRLRRDRGRPARPRHPVRGGRRAPAFRQADPLRGAARHPLRLVPLDGRGRHRHRRGEGHPQRRAVRGGRRDVAASCGGPACPHHPRLRPSRSPAAPPELTKHPTKHLTRRRRSDPHP